MVKGARGREALWPQSQEASSSQDVEEARNDFSPRASVVNVAVGHRRVSGLQHREDKFLLFQAVGWQPGKLLCLHNRQLEVLPEAAGRDSAAGGGCHSHPPGTQGLGTNLGFLQFRRSGGDSGRTGQRVSGSPRKTPQEG